MSFAARYRKHPVEVIRATFPFSTFLADNDDDYASHLVSTDDGLYIISTTESSGDVSALVGAGLNGRHYTVACEMVTVGGLKKRVEVQVRVRGRGALQGPVIDGGTPDSSDSPIYPFPIDGGSPDDDSGVAPINGGGPDNDTHGELLL